MILKGIKINANVICEVLRIFQTNKLNNFQVQPFCHTHSLLLLFYIQHVVCEIQFYSAYNIGNEIAFLEEIYDYIIWLHVFKG